MITSAGGRVADGVLPFSPFHQRVLRFSLAAIVLSSVACHDNVTEPPERSPTFSLEKASTNSGDLQRDTVLATIEPLRVVVRLDGDVAQGIQVFWLISADGLTETSTTISDAAGVASLALRFGPKPLIYSVQATLRKTVSGPSVTFTVTATAAQATAIHVMSGANQTDTVTAQLSTAYAVQATDDYGNRVAGVEIDWAVTAGGGSISPQQSLTSADGVATARHTLGPFVGVNEATVSAFGISTPITFRATGTAAKPSTLKLISGNNQSGEINRPLAADYVVRVTDTYGNAIVGVGVDWSITSGGGSLSVAKSVTGADGSAAIRLTLGASAGPQEVTAIATELPGAPRVGFTSTAIAPPPPPPPSSPPPPTQPPQSPPLATMRVTIATTGTDLDDSFLLYAQLCTNLGACGGGPSLTVNSNSITTLVLPPGAYNIALLHVALNCAVVENSRKVTLTSEVPLEVAFNVTCHPRGLLRVTATTSGTDVPLQYWIEVDGRFAANIGAQGSVQLELTPGLHVIQLSQVSPNCSVTTTNPVRVTLSDALTNVAFSVSCVANPTLRVTVTTTGTNIPASYVVGVGYEYYGNAFLYSTSVPANGVASLRIPAGSYPVVLQGVPAHCVQSASWLPVTMSLGATVNVAFAVTC